VVTCPLANCRPSPFAADIGATELAVDDTGVYWIVGPTGAVHTCPLGGCLPAGAITLASSRTQPSHLTLGAGFVYWVEDNAIVKIAKR